LIRQIAEYIPPEIPLFVCGYRKFHILGADVVATGKTAELSSLKNLMQGWRTNGRRKAALEVD
jgi:hypothetical protein